MPSPTLCIFRNRVGHECDHRIESCQPTLLLSLYAKTQEKSTETIKYGILYQIRGDYKKSRGYFEKCIDAAEKSEGETRNKDISTACNNKVKRNLF